MPRAHRQSVRGRRLIEAAVLVLIFLLLFRTLGAEPYGVPTGSMAPNLLGHHVDAVCPRCGMPLRIGVREENGVLRGESSEAHCMNCGLGEIELARSPITRGDLVLVNRSVFDFRRPRRWEMAVFHCAADHGKAYVKRVIGLPGERVEIRDGDVYIDHQIARKTLAECRAVGIPVVDSYFLPSPNGWTRAWEAFPTTTSLSVEGQGITLNSLDSPNCFAWLVYRHGPGAESKERPITDEYAYNGGDPARTPWPVHDFLLECDLEVRQGDGEIGVTINDGKDELMVALPTGAVGQGTRLMLPARNSDGDTPDPDVRRVLRTAPNRALTAGRTHRVELALVDRRLSFALDGTELFPPFDLPPADERQPVSRPFRIGGRGVELRVHQWRLLRDIHYTNVGRHGIGVPVPLGAGEYFVLGDNSPHSDDSRFWTDVSGNYLPVRKADFVGKPFLVHLPSRFAAVEAFGRRWQFQTMDWSRIRWLH
jgi:signal peptidase I